MIILFWQRNSRLVKNSGKKGLLNYPCNKIYKRELIEKGSPVRFQEGKEPGEDFLFNYEYMERCKNGVMLEKHFIEK